MICEFYNIWRSILDTTVTPATPAKTIGTDMKQEIGEEIYNTFEMDQFARRHIGPDQSEIQTMLKQLGVSSLAELTQQSLPESIAQTTPLKLEEGLSETELLAKAWKIASKNKVFKSYLGQGYYGTQVPGVILRNILENPGWYTAYTPYQAEISQGRMEALLNFQTMIMDLTGMELANASLLDEGTAAAEAMAMAKQASKNRKATKIFVSENIFPQTLEVLSTRAEPVGIEVVVDNINNFEPTEEYFATLIQYPGADGDIPDLKAFVEKSHSKGALSIVAADLLALALLQSPGEAGADIAIGTSQRFGVPFGFGGPHAAYLATKEAYKRMIPGRIIGVSQDADGNPALRLALQTREQHIRREKATSNICTAQVLLAVMASMYAVYHGPKGIKFIADKVHGFASAFQEAMKELGFQVVTNNFFDTVKVNTGKQTQKIYETALKQQINVFKTDDQHIQVSFDETTSLDSIQALVECFNEGKKLSFSVFQLVDQAPIAFDAGFFRKSDYLTAKVFNTYHSETEMLRYIKSLEVKDLTLANAMIPLGSCTMKLNATAEMIPITWPEFSDIHPFAPLDQAQGYMQLIKELEDTLCEITGFKGISLQPNAGSQGEYAGLLVIRKYLESIGQGNRDICLIPSSAHGTNPASAVMAGMKVVVVKCDDNGNVDMADLKEKAEAHKDKLAALMITYPSTHGVYEETIREICHVIHEFGGQVYMDGANLNALVGVSRPGEFGADVSHLNLHKTFCIPHGGGGPGIGPIGVAEHLKPFLPKHCMVKEAGPETGIGAVSAGPWGSAGILPISWAYIQMMGKTSLRVATEVAVLNANYLASRLEEHYPVLYKGKSGRVAHECIIDVRPLKETAGITVDDIAKRLMDFAFHAPTMSWPVAGTLMIEPTESESKVELDRFIDAMIQIRKEIRAIEEGKADKENNVLKNAPHSLKLVTADTWDFPYSRSEAAYAAPGLRDGKYWPSVRRVDNAYGDKNLVCTCLPLEAYSTDPS